MTSRLVSVLAASISLALFCSATHAQESAAVPAIPARSQTQPTASGEANSAVIVRDAAKPARSHVVATSALGGLEVYDLAGKRIGTTPSGEVAAVDVAYGVPFGNATATVLASIDTTTNSLRLFTMDGAKLAEVGARPLPFGFAAEGVCLYRHRAG